MKGGRYLPPHRKRLAEDLLDKAEGRETDSLKDALIRLARQKKSGSIVLDGRKSISKRPMVSFLFHSADGTWLIECVDTSEWRSEMNEDETKGDWIFDKVVGHIDALNTIAGGEVVDQVITDSAGDCKKARERLKKKYRGRICVSACAAHTLDLLLEDIGKIKRFANTIAKMRVIGKVIMNIGAIRHEYKDKNGGKELDRYCDTRFGTCCIMCESAKENKSALRKTVVSEAFDDFMKNKKKPKKNQPSYFSFTKGEGLSHHGLGKLTKECVLHDTFWEDIDEFLTITAEPYKSLRLTDSNNPTSGEIFPRMCKLKDSIRVNEFVTAEGRTFKLANDEHRTIKKAVEDRWDMLHSDLHSAAYILNPRYHHTHDFSGTAMQQHDALLQKWLSDEDLHTYKAEFRSYKEKTDIFSAQTIWTERALGVDAHVWWDNWGSGKKVLHDFATRVTSQPVSIGSAERCWKAYANIHCAKRNRLGSRAAKLTFTHYNMRLRHVRENPTFEPVSLPPMELDPIDAEADDFDRGSDSDAGSGSD